jgi:hypothetical protein
MSSRILATGVLLLLTACPNIASAQVRSIEGTYRNPALGYSIQIPPGLKGVTDDQDGPERSLRISLASGGDMVVFGEPNSLEYKTPEDGLKDELELKDCDSGQRKIKPAIVGNVKGASGRLVCGDRVLNLFLAFRPGGEPIYWFRLETTRTHEPEDKALFAAVATSFKLIPWK